MHSPGRKSGLLLIRVAALRRVDARRQVAEKPGFGNLPPGGAVGVRNLPQTPFSGTFAVASNDTSPATPSDAFMAFRSCEWESAWNGSPLFRQAESPYWCLKAMTGLTREARSDGPRQARNATDVKIKATEAIVAGSRGPTSYRRLCMKRVRAKAAQVPIKTPVTATPRI
jgi:hypothetical protein